jgi:signal transduction histidine kinase
VATSSDERPPLPPQPGRRGLWLGILAYRWAAFAWMVLLAIGAAEEFRRPAVAWLVLGATGLWTLWLSVTPGWDRPLTRWLDLGVCTGLLLISGIVMREGYTVGDHPFFATAYPVCAALTWGASRGVGPGLAAGFVLSVALTLSRPINGISPADATGAQIEGLGNGVVYYIAAGGAMGLISRTLGRASEELRRSQEEVLRERERVARLSEHATMGRQIHDSVLQALAWVNKRGHELGAQTSVPGREVLRLADMAEQQERALRALIQREPEEPPKERASLRVALDADARAVGEVPVTVTTLGPIWLPEHEIDEVTAAVRQALENVVQHARATRAVVFAEEGEQGLVVTVRDDGIGFVYEEDGLRSRGKFGLLESMKGRIEDLGGRMTVRSAPGSGTEVEFLIPEHGSGNDRAGVEGRP